MMSSSLKVCKFGGTSLADAAQMRKVQRIVTADADRRVVVVSAPGKRTREDHKITDLLYLCHANAQGGVGIDAVFPLIAERFNGIVSSLGLALNLSDTLTQTRERIIEEARAGRPADFAASRGEFLSAHIVSAMLGWPMVDAAEVVFFDKRGRLDAEQTYAAIASAVERAMQAGGAGVVIPGFYGRDMEGHLKTFSRGGSDVTGSIVARALRSSVYENWTDVSGLLMADPRIIDSPATIDTITYRELRELSYMGATVLHPEAVFPVREAGIPVNIRNTEQPDHPGTRIVGSTSDDAQGSRYPITGVAGRKDFTVITLEKAMMNNEVGFGERALSVLRKHGVSFEHMPSGIDTLSLVIADAELNGKLDTLTDALRAECRPDSIDTDRDLALVAVVGRGMKTRPGMAARVFGALGEARVNIRMIDQGSSELNIIVGVSTSDFEAALKAIYAAFVGEK